MPDPVPPHRKDPFNCPHCGVYTKHDVQAPHGDDGPLMRRCTLCGKNTIFVGESVVYPLHGLAPEPNADLAEAGQARKYYDEAALVLPFSSRASGALLRLSMEELLETVQPGAGSLNDKIGALVTSGSIPDRIQKAADAVRITGNNAVHPGKIDDADIPELVASMFNLVNIVAQHLITNVKAIDAIYEGLPEEAKDQVEKRDAGAT